MNGQVDAIFAPVSTGGTLAGVGRFLHEVSPSTRIIGVDAYGSVRPSSFLSADLYDTSILVKDEEAFACCRALYNAAGILVGGSSGAVLAACVQYLATHPELDDVVCICADMGENYTSSIFSDTWIEQQKLHLPEDLISSVRDMICLAAAI